MKVFLILLALFLAVCWIWLAYEIKNAPTLKEQVEEGQKDFIDEKSHIPFDTIKSESNDFTRNAKGETVEL